VPPAEAVALLDDTLSRIVLGLGVPVIMVAGNHDSPERLSFGHRVLGRQGLHVFGDYEPEHCRPVTLEDRHGPVHFHAVPYAEPPLVRERLRDEDIHDQRD